MDRPEFQVPVRPEGWEPPPARRGYEPGEWLPEQAALAEERPTLADRLLPFDPGLPRWPGFPCARCWTACGKGSAPRRGPGAGPAMTSGDVLAAASLMVGGGAFGTAPEGAIRAGVLRTGWTLSADDLGTVSSRLPDNWLVGPIKDKEGHRWFDPSDGGNGSRVDAGGPSIQHSSQQAAHVVVRRSDPASCIGVLLRVKREAEATGRVAGTPDRLLEGFPRKAGRDTFVHDPLWAEVVAAAREARAVLDRPDLPGIVRHPGADGLGPAGTALP